MVDVAKELSDDLHSKEVTVSGWFKQVAEGLKIMHSNKYVHSDIKLGIFFLLFS